jgi:hypothetical protein
MRLISEYMSDDESRTARVFHREEKSFVVVVRSDTGTHYSTQFTALRVAEDFAEDWILKDE